MSIVYNVNRMYVAVEGEIKHKKCGASSVGRTKGGGGGDDGRRRRCVMRKQEEKCLLFSDLVAESFWWGTSGRKRKARLLAEAGCYCVEKVLKTEVIQNSSPLIPR